RLPAAVRGVGHGRSPLRLRPLAVAGSFREGEVRHEVVGCGAVPMPLVRGCVDDVPRANLGSPPAAWLHEPCSLGHVEDLADGVGVPRGARSWCKADDVDADARGLLTTGDGVDPDVTGEPLG